MVEAVLKTLLELGVRPTESHTIEQIAEAINESIGSTYVPDKALLEAAERRAHKVAYTYNAHFGCDYSRVEHVCREAFLDGAKMAKGGEIDDKRLGGVNLVI